MKGLIIYLCVAPLCFLINGCDSTIGPTGPEDALTDIAEPLLSKVEVTGLRGVFEAEAVLSPLAPSPVTVGAPISASVDFGMSFSSIDQVCFIFQFQDDLLDFGELLSFNSPPGLEGAGFKNVFDTPQSVRTLCFTEVPAAIALFLDGQEDFGIQMEIGSVIISSLKVRITGEPIFPFAAFNIRKAKVKLSDQTDGDTFAVLGKFALNSSSDGLDVVNEDVTVTFDGFSQTIPAGSFVRRGKRFQFLGASAGITRMVISDSGHFMVIAKALELNEIDLTISVFFSLQIGNDRGATEIAFNDRGVFNTNHTANWTGL